MSVVVSDRPEGLHPPAARVTSRLIEVGRRLVVGRREGSIVAFALGAFVVLWMLFDTVSMSTVGVRTDAREASLWAQHFAFGYKHPPMTAWLFSLGFAVFPRTDWALHFLTVTIDAITLAVTWRLLRDHLDKNRALFGLAALFLIPLYNYKAAELNANTVMMPFWAAALLFYLRARRSLTLRDAALAGAFAGLAVLGKYWAVYLVAGMAAASIVGAGTRRFWRSPTPYVMAAGAAIVLAPHLYWYISQMGGTNYAFIRDSVMTGDSFGTALGKSAYYILGAIAYAAGPLVLLAGLRRPSRALFADIAWPADEGRRQTVILFAVPLLLPALINLWLPQRLTPDWTYPNWALLPVVLYASHLLVIDARKVSAAGWVALAATLACVVASPVIAYQRLLAGADPNRPDSQLVAQFAGNLADKPMRLYWGSSALTGNLPFYVAGANRLDGDPLSAASGSKIAANGLLLACLDDDASCRATQDALDGAGLRTASGTISRSFLGFSAQPRGFRVTVVPAQR
jgi:hypothetical protein